MGNVNTLLYFEMFVLCTVILDGASEARAIHSSLIYRIIVYEAERSFPA